MVTFRLLFIALVSWLLLGSLVGCGQSPPLSTAVARRAAVPATGPSPRRAAPVCVPVVGVAAQELADGSRIFFRVERAENSVVPGWARYRPDGQLDTAFCRRATQAAPHVSRVLAAPKGKFWVERASGKFGVFEPPFVARLNADGTADASFTTTLRGFFTAWCALPDGGLLLGGEYLTMGQQSLGSVACLRPDGTLDAAFTAALGSSRGSVTALVRQHDGRVLVAGQRLEVSGQPACSLLRLTAQGKLDPTFQVLPATNSPLMACTLQADDKPLVLLGRGLGALVRLLPNGGPDPAFVLRLRQPFYIRNGQPPLLAMADGRILLPGYLSEAPPAAGAAWRSLVCVSATGAEDTTFHYSARPDWINSLQQLPHGQVLVATTPVYYPQLPATRRTAATVVVLAPNGRPVAGQALPLIEQAGSVDALAKQADGKLLVGGGFSAVGSHPAQGLARLNLDGTLDTAFARRCAADGPVAHLVVQPDGRILVAGYFQQVGGLRRPMLARLLPDGRPDTTFAPPLAYWAELGAYLQGLAVQADGKVLLAGKFKLANGQEQKLLRLTATGQPDPTFQPPKTTEDAGLLLVQPDGKILVASSPVLLRRLLPNGSFDPDFAVIRHSGIVTALAQYPDGRILVGGSFSAGGFNGIPALESLARLQPNGTADPDFHPPALSFNFVQGLGIQADGRLWVGGSGDPTYRNSSPPLFRLLRLLPQGPPDPQFNPQTGPEGEVKTLLAMPDGAVFVGGQFTTSNSVPSFSLSRLPAPAPAPSRR